VTELETRLAGLRDEIVFPETPSLEVPAPAASRRRSRRRSLGLALAVVVAVSTAVLAASPGARSALRDLLGIGGVTAIRVDALPEPGAPPGYLPGRPVSLPVAQEAVTFRIRVPAAGPAPRAVLLDERPSGGAVSFVWSSEPTAIQLTQFEGTENVRFAEKLLGGGTRVERFRLDGREAVWIEGAPHVVRFLDRSGTLHESESRVAGNVLLWRDGEVTLRLEGRLTRDEAVGLARAIR
jgi:hypothetical protein